jgi:hypothetical protein
LVIANGRNPNPVVTTHFLGTLECACRLTRPLDGGDDPQIVRF